MSGQEEIFQRLAEEKASGQLFTVKDWLVEHPPRPEAFKQTIAGAADRIRQGDTFPLPVREFLDEFALLPTKAQREHSIQQRPAPTGDRRFDAYLAALAELLAATHGLSRPDWACEPDRFLDTFWFPSEIAGFRPMAVAQSPGPFRRRCIFISAASLQRV